MVLVLSDKTLDNPPVPAGTATLLLKGAHFQLKHYGLSNEMERSTRVCSGEVTESV